MLRFFGLRFRSVLLLWLCIGGFRLCTEEQRNQVMPGFVEVEARTNVFVPHLFVPGNQCVKMHATALSIKPYHRAMFRQDLRPCPSFAKAKVCLPNDGMILNHRPNWKESIPRITSSLRLFKFVLGHAVMVRVGFQGGNGPLVPIHGNQPRRVLA